MYPFVIEIRDLQSLYRNVELFIIFFKGTLYTLFKRLYKMDYLHWAF